MIRERRSKEKLQQYFRRFVEQGVIDPNVHPWVAESWQRSRDWRISRDSLQPSLRLSKTELEERREQHRYALNFLDNLYQDIKGYFNMYNLSLLLLDNECYALKNYALPFFQKSPGEVEGARLAEEDVGTSSIAIAYRHQSPFLVFGPEMWIEDGQGGDACSAPIFLDGKLQYIITIVSTQQGELPSGAIEALIMMMKHTMENDLALLDRLKAKHAILDAMPLAAYHLLPGGKIGYANRLGRNRLGTNETEAKQEEPNLEDAVMNYQHTALAKGFRGVPSYNKEVTWITPRKTYEDITTVLPLYRDGEVASVVAISFSIEDLKMLEAHATSYTARYSLASMVGSSTSFTVMRDKAARAARSGNHVLLQGETGTGKQRLAHAIHQSSSRAAGPLITVRCADLSTEMLERELFGVPEQSGETRPGKLELANGGTLFLDEIEKLPAPLAERVAETVITGRMKEKPNLSLDIRLIAACDSDLKRLTEKGRFPAGLFELIAKPTIRVPALRSRREDMPLIAGHIIQELAEQHGMLTKQLSPQAVTLLQSYDWPGNIKQLQAVVEQAFFHTAGDVIEAAAIKLPGECGPTDTWKEDRDAFVAAWQTARGNISRLSGMLGVSRVTLYRYLKKYGLEKE